MLCTIIGHSKKTLETPGPALPPVFPALLFLAGAAFSLLLHLPQEEQPANTIFSPARPGLSGRSLGDVLDALCLAMLIQSLARILHFLVQRCGSA